MSGEEEENHVSEQTEPRSFAHAIATLCEGEANGALSSDMHELLLVLSAEASARRKKVKGTLKLDLVFEVDDNGVVGIAYSVKTKAPEPRRQTAVMWLKGGNLTPENPRQQKLPLREVNAGGDAREVENHHATKEA